MNSTHLVSHACVSLMEKRNNNRLSVNPHVKFMKLIYLNQFLPKNAFQNYCETNHLFSCY